MDVVDLGTASSGMDMAPAYVRIMIKDFKD
jgi:hypothetical protein